MWTSGGRFIEGKQAGRIMATTNGMVNGFTHESGCFLYQDTELLPQVFSNLNKLRKNRQFCDVIFQVHEVAAHKAVLASASPYLLDLLTREQGGSQGPSLPVKLGPNFELEAFEALVDYCYTGRLQAPSSQVHHLFTTAHRLKLGHASRKCGDYLVSNLQPSNCISIRSLQGLASDPDLVAKVDAYIRQNFEKIYKSKELLTMSTVRVEVVQDSSEHKASINPRRLCGLILEWLRHEGLSLNALCSRVHLLYMTTDHGLRDCNEIAAGDCKDTELVQDYKKLTRRVNGGGGAYPAVSRHFLYSKSDSQSSLSSLSDAENEVEWRVIASLATGDHKVVGLLVGGWQADGSLMAAYTAIPAMSSPRCSVGTAQLQGKLLVCGGYDRGECLKTVEVYDTDNNTWTMLKPMRVPRGRFDITVVDDKLPPSPIVRSNAGVCSLDNKIYVVGGWNGQRGLSRCDMFDPDTRTWTNIANLKTGRNQCGVAAMNGALYAVGGCEAWNCLNSVEKYSLSTGTWSYLAPMATPRRGCGVVPYHGKLYVIGGHDGVYSLCTTEIYDPETDTWSPGPSLTSCRANVGVAVVRDRLYAVGGFNGKAFLNTIEFLDPHLNEWTTFVPGDQPRNGCFTSQPPPLENGTSNNNHHNEVA
ncbi:IVNS1ABP [Cordylochernes scorpioides]|uniref:Kelch-like protein diablo n=1 Tax=Cordylochernes scorpioides TaxID=51811 RepID=A0ABY6KEM7_9ARAC|nr:IVNS1ABP [Cordylochernes scorpioides]